MTQQSAYQTWQAANSALQSGNVAEAKQLLVEGTSAFRDDAEMFNSAGSLYQKMGDTIEAERHFARALELDPASLNIAVNYAISLTALNRNHEALAVLSRYEKAGAKSALYASTRGLAARGANQKSEAARWYDHALQLEPNRIKALHGRARVSLERGEPDAPERFNRALSVNQGDADLWLGKAQALDVAGDTVAAREIAEALVEKIPQWSESLRFLAQLRLAAGESDFASHYGEAARKVPQDPNIYADWCGVLAGLDFNQEAADIAAKGVTAFPAIQRFAFLEANYAGAAGDVTRAEALYSKLTQDDAERWLHEARHRLRNGEYEHANGLLNKVIAEDPWNISAWALRGLVWRLTDDPRSDWLHGQAELVQLAPLVSDTSVLENVAPVLHALHDNSPLPLGQSLRGGSQTRAHLFDRTEAEISALEQAIRDTVQAYQQSQLPQDNAHPLLRHRASSWTLAGSWSVRLSGGGDYHTSHIHPEGIVSSALYIELPDTDPTDPMAGWLEIGRPAADLQLDLEPLRIIKPKTGHLALFPSTLYHGTRPFTDAQRMTVAFDVTLAPGEPTS